MALLFWDASAIVKRYWHEEGSDTVDAVFAHSSGHTMATTPVGYAETYSILLRRLNSGVLDIPTFSMAASALETEVVVGEDFGLMSITDTIVFESIPIMRKHNLNSTDAAIVALLVGYGRMPGSETVLLIAADKRLLRAAKQEGFRVINPEENSPAEIPSLLGTP